MYLEKVCLPGLFCDPKAVKQIIFSKGLRKSDAKGLLPGIQEESMARLSS